MLETKMDVIATGKDVMINIAVRISKTGNIKEGIIEELTTQMDNAGSLENTCIYLLNIISELDKSTDNIVIATRDMAKVLFNKALDVAATNALKNDPNIDVISFKYEYPIYIATKLTNSKNKQISKQVDK
jgi:hypothetical protein